MIPSYMKSRYLVKHGHAVINIEKVVPDKDTHPDIKYSVDSECHACWHQCGTGCPCDSLEEANNTVKELLNRFRKCKEGKPKIHIWKDERQTQMTFGGEAI